MSIRFAEEAVRARCAEDPYRCDVSICGYLPIDSRPNVTPARLWDAF
jgi:hypothetical protein